MYNYEFHTRLSLCKLYFIAFGFWRANEHVTSIILEIPYNYEQTKLTNECAGINVLNVPSLETRRAAKAVRSFSLFVT